MELGDAGFAADQEAPPYQGADIPKDYSKLIKFCHLRSLPDHARNLHNLSPRNLPLSDHAALSRTDPQLTRSKPAFVSYGFPVRRVVCRVTGTALGPP
jgi:hypothetical protein